MTNLTTVLETTLGTTYRPGNQVDILQNGDEIFPAMLDAIAEAKRTIYFSTYVWWRSRIANEFAEALAQRARAGVAVYVILDAIGAAKGDPKTIQLMEAAGVHVTKFRPLRWYSFHKFGYRNHRKLLIVDGTTGFTGGVGIADEWTGQAQDAKHWRDTQLRVIGPSAQDLSAGFIDMWLEATGELLSPDTAVTAGQKPGVGIQLVVSTPAKGHTAALKMALAITRAAKERIWISSAYFSPTRELVDELIAAASRGVDVRILTNGPKTNHPIARRAGQALYWPLLRSGIAIYEFRRTVMHSKAITVDGEWSTIGSINLNSRSLLHDEELNLCMIDKTIARTLDQQFLQDIERSRKVTLRWWSRRPWTSRILELYGGLFRRHL